MPTTTQFLGRQFAGGQLGEAPPYYLPLQQQGFDVLTGYMEDPFTSSMVNQRQAMSQEQIDQMTANRRRQFLEARPGFTSDRTPAFIESQLRFMDLMGSKGKSDALMQNLLWAEQNRRGAAETALNYQPLEVGREAIQQTPFDWGPIIAALGGLGLGLLKRKTIQDALDKIKRIGAPPPGGTTTTGTPPPDGTTTTGVPPPDYGRYDGIGIPGPNDPYTLGDLGGKYPGPTPAPDYGGIGFPGPEDEYQLGDLGKRYELETPGLPPGSLGTVGATLGGVGGTLGGAALGTAGPIGAYTATLTYPGIAGATTSLGGTITGSSAVGSGLGGLGASAPGQAAAGSTAAAAGAGIAGQALAIAIPVLGFLAMAFLPGLGAGRNEANVIVPVQEDLDQKLGAVEAEIDQMRASGQWDAVKAQTYSNLLNDLQGQFAQFAQQFPRAGVQAINTIATRVNPLKQSLSDDLLGFNEAGIPEDQQATLQQMYGERTGRPPGVPDTAEYDPQYRAWIDPNGTWYDNGINKYGARGAPMGSAEISQRMNMAPSPFTDFD